MTVLAKRLKAGVLAAAIACIVAPAAAQAPAAGGEPPAGTAVLNTFSSWRMFHVLAPPELALDGGPRPAVFEQYWLNLPSAPPPADWTGADFDDSEWLRGPALMTARTPFVARACFRGRFEVKDPAAVKKLTIWAAYHGGVIVYVNGQEVRRSHLPPGAGPPLAEAYPLEAFVGPDGVLLATERTMVMAGGRMTQAGKPSEENQRRMALWRRTLAEVEVPAGFLRKGVNVLAVEVVRAPYHKVVDEKKTQSGGGPGAKNVYDMHWNTCQLLAVSLTAAGGEGLGSNPPRPAGLSLWNSTIVRGDFDLDFGDPCEKLRPIAVTGVRNGCFSGKVVAGSTKPIKGLRASITDLKGAGGAIPASAVRIRYAGQGGAEYGAHEPTYGWGAETIWPRKAGLIGVLYDEPPKEVPLRAPSAKRVDGLNVPPYAVVPIWVTIRVPDGAAGGTYEGTLTVEADGPDGPPMRGGERPVAVPVRLTVLDWTLPDPYDFKTWIEMIQSPDTLQLEYGVEPWSPRHLELIARSMRFLREVGSGVLYVPLLAETNQGNADSMVRWIRRGENRYDFDFSAMDKYLDAAAGNMGKPKVVCFIVWEVYLLEKSDRVTVRFPVDESRQRKAMVSVLDPATGRLKTEFVPNTDDPAMKPVWQSLFAELHKRMKARGWEDAMMVGCMCDAKPKKEEVMFWREVTGDLPWVSHSHWTTANKGYYAKVLGTGFKTGYMTSIYETTFPQDPNKGRLYGWKNPLLHAQNIRSPEIGMVPGTMMRCFGEINIAGGQRGFGRLGGDFWAAIKDKNGRRTGKAFERFPHSSWSNLDLKNSLLAPGPEGAVATSRFELLREGVQECEARIFLEGVLTEPSRRAGLGEELARRCQEMLDERTLCVQRGVANFEVNCYGYCTPWNWVWQEGIAGHNWFQSSGWRERTAALYATAGEVARRLAGR